MWSLFCSSRLSSPIGKSGSTKGWSELWVQEPCSSQRWRWRQTQVQHSRRRSRGSSSRRPAYRVGVWLLLLLRRPQGPVAEELSQRQEGPVRPPAPRRLSVTNFSPSIPESTEGGVSTPFPITQTVTTPLPSCAPPLKLPSDSRLSSQGPSSKPDPGTSRPPVWSLSSTEGAAVFISTGGASTAESTGKYRWGGGCSFIGKEEPFWCSAAFRPTIPERHPKLEPPGDGVSECLNSSQWQITAKLLRFLNEPQ